MIFKFRRTRPDMHTSRSAWEVSWEEDLNVSWDPSVIERASQSDVYSLAGLGHLPVSDAIALALHEYLRHICDLQRDLAKEAARRFAENDFENAWLSQSHEKRCEVVMEGIYKTMCIPGMEIRRKFCPDSTLSYLTSKQGRTYIDMLKAVLPSDINADPTEPLHFPHPIVDRVLSLTAENERKPGAVAMCRMTLLFRTYCLTAVIWNTLLAFYGISEAFEVQRAPRTKPDDLKHNSPNVISIPSRVIREDNAIRKRGTRACWSCGKSEKTLEQGRKLLTCGKCRGIERKVLYCSRECQIQDWRNGKPRPHKDICGRPMDEEDIISASAATVTTSGYKPSPALLHQKSLLSQRPESDYLIFMSPPTPDIGIIFYPSSARTQFQSVRSQAFESGDPEAVKKLFIMIARHPGLSHYDLDAVDIQKQLEREFGLSLGHVELDDQT